MGFSSCAILMMYLVNFSCLQNRFMWAVVTAVVFFCSVFFPSSHPQYLLGLGIKFGVRREEEYGFRSPTRRGGYLKSQNPILEHRIWDFLSCIDPLALTSLVIFVNSENLDLIGRRNCRGGDGVMVNSISVIFQTLL